MRSDIPSHEPSCDRTQKSKHKQTPHCIIGSFGDKDECTAYRDPRSADDHQLPVSLYLGAKEKGTYKPCILVEKPYIIDKRLTHLRDALEHFRVPFRGDE